MPYVPNPAFPLPLADMDLVAMMAMGVPLLAIVLAIVSVLAAHQRKMAEIIHNSKNNQPNPELDAIKSELQHLRMQMNQQTITLDDMRSKQPLPTAEVQERLGGS